MPKIIIIGGGGHTLSCIDVTQSHKKFSFAGVILKDKKDKTKYNFISGTMPQHVTLSRKV